MADTKTADTSYEGILEAVKGHDRIVVEDGGEEYVLRYPLRTIREMEQSGVTPATAGEMLDGTLTGAEEFVEKFVAPAFKAEQPKMKLEDVTRVWEDLPDKATVIAYLSALFSQPTLALTTDPTQTRAKFRLV
jgi:hypothetical protein